MLELALRTTVAAGFAVLAASVQAQEIKVGLMLPYTGVAAEIGQQNDRGIEQFLKLNADKLKPYTFRLIRRDEKDASGSNAKNVIQELITQDKVDILLGWIYSPNAIATATLVTAGKIPAIITNAATAHITNLSPYYVRVSGSMWHPAHSIGVAAAKQHK